VNATQRRERLAADLAALRSVQDASTILRFETTGESPDRYAITFRGKGFRRDPSTGEIVNQTLHQCDLRLTLSYPRYPPDVRWLTPLLHPNISFSGFIRMEDIGIPWSEELSLDVICERLWDVARLAYCDLENATNYVARKWVQEQREVSLPADARPLRDKVTAANTNIIQYRRRGDQRLSFPQQQQCDDILYIDENTPTPTINLGRPRQGGDRDDVLYIGDDS
jgi:ubiquitin-protein ligase